MYYNYKDKDIFKKVTTPYESFKKLNILLIRHGESEANALQEKLKQKKESLGDDLKIEDSIIRLSPKGEEQAIALGKKIKKYMTEKEIKKDEVLVLISPYERARKTFEKSNEEIKFDEENDNIFILNSLREQSYGAFHMISNDVKKQKFAKIYDECQKNKTSFFRPQFLGESPAEVSDRLWKVLEFIEEKTKNTKIKNVFIFAHLNVNKCMIMNILNLPPELYDDLKTENNASIWQIRYGKLNLDKVDILN